MRVQRSHSSKCVHFLRHKRHRETEHTCCWEFFNAAEVAGVYLRADMLIVAGKIVTICINCTPPGVVWLIRLQGPQLGFFRELRCLEGEVTVSGVAPELSFRLIYLWLGEARCCEPVKKMSFCRLENYALLVLSLECCSYCLSASCGVRPISDGSIRGRVSSSVLSPTQVLVCFVSLPVCVCLNYCLCGV